MTSSVTVVVSLPLLSRWIAKCSIDCNSDEGDGRSRLVKLDGRGRRSGDMPLAFEHQEIYKTRVSRNGL